MANAITPVVRAVMKEFQGASVNLRLPSKAIESIAERNPSEVTRALKELAQRHPRAITEVSGEVGDTFVRASATMREGDKVVANIAAEGDASFLDMIRTFLLGGYKNLPVKKEAPVCEMLKRLDSDVVTKDVPPFKTLNTEIFDKIKKG